MTPEENQISVASRFKYLQHRSGVLQMPREDADAQYCWEPACHS